MQEAERTKVQAKLADLLAGAAHRRAARTDAEVLESLLQQTLRMIDGVDGCPGDQKEECSKRHVEQRQCSVLRTLLAALDRAEDLLPRIDSTCPGTDEGRGAHGLRAALVHGNAVMQSVLPGPRAEQTRAVLQLPWLVGDETWREQSPEWSPALVTLRSAIARVHVEVSTATARSRDLQTQEDERVSQLLHRLAEHHSKCLAWGKRLHQHNESLAREMAHHRARLAASEKEVEVLEYMRYSEDAHRIMQRLLSQSQQHVKQKLEEDNENIRAHLCRWALKADDEEEDSVAPGGNAALQCA